jgi:hypothetical protein
MAAILKMYITIFRKKNHPAAWGALLIMKAMWQDTGKQIPFLFFINKSFWESGTLFSK